MTFLERAKKFAHDGHNSINQTRKYGNKSPYWVHTDEVARIVSLFTKDKNVIAAAHFHDLVEDVYPKNPNYSIVDIALNFGGDVAKYVTELTDVYVSEKFPDLNRKRRKELEAIRLGQISNESKLIKLADLFSNTRSIVFHDRDFAKVYLKEKARVLKYIKVPNKILWNIVYAQLKLAELYLWVFKIVDKTRNKVHN